MLVQKQARVKSRQLIKLTSVRVNSATLHFALLLQLAVVWRVSGEDAHQAGAGLKQAL